jgi:hypothetical protein
MAKPKNGEANGNVADAGAEEAAKAPPTRFQVIETERHMYNVNACWDEMDPKERKPLVGYLLAEISMPPIKGRDWTAFLFKTTEDTFCIDRDDNVIPVSAGSEVLIPGTHQLRSHLSRAAAHPAYVFEVRIEPNKKVAIGGGQEMWSFKLANNPKPLPRSKFGTAALLNAPTAPPMLPAASGNPDAEDPFA